MSYLFSDDGIQRAWDRLDTLYEQVEELSSQLRLIDEALMRAADEIIDIMALFPKDCSERRARRDA